jgi:hypothetical protein
MTTPGGLEEVSIFLVVGYPQGLFDFFPPLLNYIQKREKGMKDTIITTQTLITTVIAVSYYNNFLLVSRVKRSNSTRTQCQR